MRCPQSHAASDNAAGACEVCGAVMAGTCPHCGSENPVAARFCCQCARFLDPGPVPLTASSAEWRQLTVLFCDLVGSTVLSRELDAEDWRDVVRRYHSACAQAVRELHGHVAQYLGDGLLVYFGYPIAFEDSPRRAIQAGLAMVDAIAKLAAQLMDERGIKLSVRVGIHSGPVVMDNVGDRPLALGDTPNQAARVQGEAEAGSVVVTEATFRLTRGFFRFTSLGARKLKGFPEPLALHRVEAETGAASRLEAALAIGLTPFVGHETERDLLAQKWEDAKGGQGPVVLLTGEPGIGKSRHVDILKEGLERERYLLLECRCSPYHQSTPLFPIIDLVERRLGLDKKLSDEKKLVRIERALAAQGENDAVSLRLMASLLSIPVPDTYPAVQLAPQARRQATLDLLLRWLQTVAATAPTLLVVEDLHWVDPSTLDFLSLLVGRESRGRLLTILTGRPEFQPPWADKPRSFVVAIGRLQKEEMGALVSMVAGGRKLPPEVLKQILSRADGVPLFLEEMTKAILESGVLRAHESEYELVAPLTAEDNPATLQASLMARFDRLGTGKQLLQLAAVLGREFQFDILQAVSSLSDDVLVRDLQGIVEAQLAFQEGQPPTATYVFKHALIQDAAYQSLLRSNRQEYHRRIAETLKQRFPAMRDGRPELLGHHCAAAGLAAEAIEHFQRAGQRAIAGGAFPEAIGHFSRGLDLLPAVSESARSREELSLRSGIGVAYLTTKGFSAKEVEETYTRSAVLCDQLLGETPLRVLYGIWAVNFVRSDLDVTTRMASNFQHLARSSSEAGQKLVAHSCVATWAFWRGDYDLSMSSALLAKELCDAVAPKTQHEDLVGKYGLDCPLYGAYYVAWCHLIRGNADQARACFRESLAVAEAIDDPYVLAVTKAYGGALYHDIGDFGAVADLAESARAISGERGFPFWLAASLVQSGWVTAKRGDPDGGVRMMREGLGVFRAIGSKAAFPYYSSYLAEACLDVGNLDEAESTLSEALAMVRTNLDKNFESELLRLQGEVLVRRDRPDEAESRFQSALALCKRQGAKMLELRSTVSLVRLLVARGHREAARSLLAGVYGTFSEGFDAPHIEAARRLLADL